MFSSTLANSLARLGWSQRTNNVNGRVEYSLSVDGRPEEYSVVLDREQHPSTSECRTLDCVTGKWATSRQANEDVLAWAKSVTPGSNSVEIVLTFGDR